MRKITISCIFAFSVVFLISSNSTAQIITTYAGGGSVLGDGGPATAGNLAYPTAVSTDVAGNLYIVDPTTNRIRKVNTAGIISTFAGNGTAGNTGDGGAASAAEINEGLYADATGGVAANAGNFYFVDSWNNTIRMVNSSGIISRIAGNGTAGFSGDGGMATAAMIDTATGIAADGSGNVYFADTKNQRIRKINSSGIISTVAGNGTAAFSGDGAAATLASLSSPSDVKVDAGGNIYIADFGNQRVRMVNTSGLISTVAGNGTFGYVAGSPATATGIGSFGGIAVDGADNLFIAGGSTVLKVDHSSGIITTFAGMTDSFSYGGDGGPATTAKLSEVMGAAFDDFGNLYIADAANGRIRKIAYAGVPTGVQVLPSNSSNNLTIFPNPNAGTFIIEGVITNTNDEKVALEITDMAGRVVYATKVDAQKGKVNTQLQLNIANGEYILKLNSSSATEVSRFIIQR